MDARCLLYFNVAMRITSLIIIIIVTIIRIIENVPFVNF